MQYRSIVSAALWSVLLTGSLATPGLALAAAAEPATSAHSADLIRTVRIEGNQRIESRTILTYLGMAPGSHFTQNEIDTGLKNLFATGFFTDVKLLRDNNTLVVRVTENPVLNNIAFEGNDRIETKDLEKEVELKPRSVYSRDKVQSDVRRILNIYRRSGRYNATVEPKVIKQDQNRVDLVYEIVEGPVARVSKISFIGNDHYDAESLRKTIRTEETRWYKFLTDNDKYDGDRMQFDEELLRRFYVNQGYADFQVKSAHAELSPSKDAFYLTYIVEEGPKYRFGTVKVSNELKGKNKPDFTKEILTKSGKRYDASQVESSIDAMTKELGNKGYAFVDIQPKLERNKEANTIDLTYEVKPGPRVYVERINVTGNVRTLDEVIRREFRLAEGDPYNTAKLQRTEQRLNNLGFFEKVAVKNEQGSEPDKTVVNVDVQEKSTGEINIGAGYSTTQGVLGSFGISENNLLGRGQQLKTNVTYGSRVKQVELGFTEPYFLDREIAAGFDIFRSKQDLINENSYESDIKGFTLRASYALQEKLQHSFSYSLRQTDIGNVQAGASIYIQRQSGQEINSSVGQALTYDERDNKFSPTTGYYFKFSQELAGLGGDAHYLKHDLRGSYYYPITPKWIFSVLGSGGYIFGYGGHDVRLNDRFFIGGDDLRGFEIAGVGPRDITTRDALGGEAYYIGTTELRFPVGLPDELGVSGAVFSDVGSLWKNSDTGPSVFDDNGPRVSGGVGALWASPFGPIRIDFVHAFVKKTQDQTQTLHFSFGTKF